VLTIRSFPSVGLMGYDGTKQTRARRLTMQRETTRRRFLQQASAWFGTGVMASMNPQSARSLRAADREDRPEDDGPIPIVDTHQHLWDLTKLRLPWLEGAKSNPLRRNFLMSDYLEAAKGLNVVKTVYMEVAVHPDDHVKEAEYVIDLCRRDDNPMVAAVIGGSPDSRDFKAYIARFAKSPYVKGVRAVLHASSRPEGTCLDPQFVENIRLLGELGLSYDLCMRPGELLDGARLVEQCPRTRFVVDHCGNMSVQSTDKKLRDRWMRGMRALAQHERVICKISGIITSAREDWKPDDLAPNISFCLETFGEDRVCFAGDWPVCTRRASLKEWVNALKHVVRNKPPRFKRKLFHDNAVKFYGLS
jgi:predicted TIM-barrel fold metal-dependent hydrolase